MKLRGISGQKRATVTDVFNSLSLTEWKAGLEIINELESKNLRANHLRGIIYVYLSRWEDEDLIKSRIRPGTEETGFPRREYLRVSTGTPRKIFEAEPLRELGLAPA